MKTRIFLTAMMIALTTCVISASNHFKGEDTLSTFNLAIISDQMTGEDTYSLPAESMSSVLTSANNDLLEEWMESRESWESENSEANAVAMESAVLQGWVESREAWEQSATETIYSPLVQPVDLEGWIAALESWEQEDAGAAPAGITKSVDLQGWIENMENWEQK